MYLNVAQRVTHDDGAMEERHDLLHLADHHLHGDMRQRAVHHQLERVDDALMALTPLCSRLHVGRVVCNEVEDAVLTETPILCRQHTPTPVKRGRNIHSGPTDK